MDLVRKPAKSFATRSASPSAPSPNPSPAFKIGTLADVTQAQIEGLEAQLKLIVDPGVRNFSVNNRKLGGTNTGVLLRLLEQREVLYGLTSLSLASCYLGFEGARVICLKLLKCPNALKKLDLSFNSLGSAGLGLLAETLKTNTTLTDLILKGNCGQITAESQKNLLGTPCPVVTFNRIRHLDLSRNDITLGRMNTVLDSLMNKDHLERLNLASNFIEDEGCRQLCLGVLQHCPKLTALDLSSNNIGTEGASAISFVLKKRKSELEELNLSDNPVGDSAFLHMCNALAKNHTLRSISFCGTRITAEVGWSLLAVLRGSKTLARVSFARTELSKDSSLSQLTVDDRCVLEFFELLRSEDGASLGNVQDSLRKCPSLANVKLWGETPSGVAYSCGNSVVAKMLAKQAGRRERDLWTALVLIASLVVVLLDVGSDIVVTINYFQSGRITAACWALGILFASDAVVCLIVFMDAHSKRKQVFKAMPDWRWKLIPLLPIYEVKSLTRGIRESFYVRSKQYQSDLEGLGLALTLGESLFEALPLLLLQIWVFYKKVKDEEEEVGEFQFEDHILDIGSMVMSLLSILKATAMYVSLRLKYRTTNWMGVRTTTEIDDYDEEDSDLTVGRRKRGMGGAINPASRSTSGDLGASQGGGRTLTEPLLASPAGPEGLSPEENL